MLPGLNSKLLSQSTRIGLVFDRIERTVMKPKVDARPGDICYGRTTEQPVIRATSFDVALFVFINSPGSAAGISLSARMCRIMVSAIMATLVVRKGH